VLLPAVARPVSFSTRGCENENETKIRLRNTFLHELKNAAGKKLVKLENIKQ